MRTSVLRRAALAAGLAVCAWSAGAAAQAAEVRVMISGAFAAAYAAIAPDFQRRTGDTLVTVSGPSMGDAPVAIPNRLARGEPADVVILARGALDGLAAKGQVAADSETDLVASRIALAVKAGAPKPDISTAAALKQTLLTARSVGYSDSASGVYVSNELFRRLGVAEAMAGKARQIPATPVGDEVAAGRVEMGFQQLSELMPIQGITIVGLLPGDLQKVTIFSAGVATHARQPAEARKLIAYLASPEVAAAIRRAGLTSVAPAAKP